MSAMYAPHAGDSDAVQPGRTPRPCAVDQSLCIELAGGVLINLHLMRAVLAAMR
jgi:hypothetical protein